MVDNSLILRKLADLDLYVNQVSEFSALNSKEYISDWKTQRIVERTLQMAIEVCVDIANHIIADKKFRVPTTYADTFLVLHENSIIDDKLFDGLTKMCKFRNIIVHEYDKIDPEIVVSILGTNLRDFGNYRSNILKLLESDSR